MVKAEIHVSQAITQGVLVSINFKLNHGKVGMVFPYLNKIKFLLLCACNI